MSWQLASFLLLALALGGGFAWYERSHPSARVLALVGTLAALAVLGRIAFAPVPNVKPTTDIVLLAGYVFGGAPGFAVGAVAALASNLVLHAGAVDAVADGRVGALRRRRRGARARQRRPPRTRPARARVRRRRAGLRRDHELRQRGDVLGRATRSAATSLYRRRRCRGTSPTPSATSSSSCLRPGARAHAAALPHAPRGRWLDLPAGRAAARSLVRRSRARRGAARRRARAAPAAAARRAPPARAVPARAQTPTAASARRRGTARLGSTPAGRHRARRRGPRPATRRARRRSRRDVLWRGGAARRAPATSSARSSALAAAGRSPRARGDDLVARLRGRRTARRVRRQVNLTAFASSRCARPARAPARAVRRAARWLARQQNADGGFGFLGRGPQRRRRHGGARCRRSRRVRGAGRASVSRAAHTSRAARTPTAAAAAAGGRARTRSRPRGRSRGSSPPAAARRRAARLALAAGLPALAAGRRTARALLAHERADAGVGHRAGARRAGRGARSRCAAPPAHGPRVGSPPGRRRVRRAYEIGVPKETAEGERRVALVPEVVEKLSAPGIEVVVQAGAGAGAMIPDVCSPTPARR